MLPVETNLPDMSVNRKPTEKKGELRYRKNETLTSLEPCFPLCLKPAHSGLARSGMPLLCLLLLSWFKRSLHPLTNRRSLGNSEPSGPYNRLITLLDICSSM